MSQANQPAYPLLEALLHIKGLTLQATYIDHWVLLRTQQGRSYGRTKNTAFRFWKILRDCGYTGKLPTSLLREKNYGVPLEQLPPQLKDEVIELLKWKQVPFNFDRPKDQHHRPVTAKRLQHALCALYGYAKNICHMTEINSMSQLIQKQIVGGFVEWCINVRNVKGQTLQRNLRLISAALPHHPAHKSLDIGSAAAAICEAMDDVSALLHLNPAVVSMRTTAVRKAFAGSKSC